MKPYNLKQKRGRILLAGILVLLLAYLLTGENQPPLSAVERQLVGEWFDGPRGSTRIFKPDRTFLTSNGQFAGVWHIDEGELAVTVWQAYELPSSLSLPGFSLSLDSIQRARIKEIYTFEIEFSENGQQHTLNHPVDKLPDGKWLWTRKTE